MDIILTHEQADFDALASLLGAYLLDEKAIPVLPRKLNRNVRAFLTLYGLELPFVDPRDLNGEPINSVCLVDTQSMVSIKGMGAETRVHVIDHHPRRDNLPENWTVTTEEIGATTTMLIEALREHDGNLTPIQATLLLLGIYEDTGSLTFTRTTPRDLRAAAYLVESGASLEIASDYLNHPLSEGQQAIYDHLRRTAETLDVHGHTVVIATGDAEETDEELSTIAHRLRDLLDPEAILLLVKTRGGVQLIARSTSSSIDVGEIAAAFGGGGHERAAAGLIRDRPLDEIHAKLVRILPEHIRPAITVSQIMSRGPQVLSPDTPAEVAAQRMRRYGYEGYPVVEDGKVVGLLTRRAVDRALAHKLNLTATSLMEAGSYTVSPRDSIEYLQRLMTGSGWGQIPVINSSSGEIIGIVTRTDLLKTLSPQPALPSRQNLDQRLEAALPPERLALLKAVARQAHEQHDAAYIVGGFVRDLLLDRPSLDFDVVVEGDAIDLAKALASEYGGRFTTHARFGTAKWHIGEIRADLIDSLAACTPQTAPHLQNPSHLPETLDLITARTEFYTHPTALPTVERGSIKLDLHRRDFTINTLALRLDGGHYGELHDYWGGLADIRLRLVRVLHSLSFVDDPTRMLRAVRFEQRFGFHIEERTLELLKEALSLLDRVSGDRIRHELDHIFSELQAPQVFARLKELGLLASIHPSLEWDSWLQSRLEALPAKLPDPDWELVNSQKEPELKRDLAYCIWLLRLPMNKANQVSKRLKLSAHLKKSVLAACGLWHDLPALVEAPPSQVARRLADTPSLSRYAVYLATSDIRIRRLLQLYATSWRKVTLGFTGHDLQARGLRPGPSYRIITEQIRDMWLDGKITSREQEAKALETLLQEMLQASG